VEREHSERAAHPLLRELLVLCGVAAGASAENAVSCSRLRGVHVLGKVLESTLGPGVSVRGGKARLLDRSRAEAAHALTALSKLMACPHGVHAAATDAPDLVANILAVLRLEQVGAALSIRSSSPLCD
jgi:hypothetical protein